MAKCNVCGKTSLMPEKFGEINVCKICYMKVNGIFWKKQYERYEDAEKQRCKTMELLNKNGYPSEVIVAINEFFVSQMETMVACECCGQLVQNRQTLGKVKICRKCYDKINTSAWRETEYENREEIEKNRDKVLKVAKRNGFPTKVVKEINKHFETELQKGLIYTIHNGMGQTLKVYETHCILYTNQSFDEREMSVRYSDALRKSRASESSLGANVVKALGYGVLLSTGTLVQTGLRVVASAAISAAANKMPSGKPLFRVVKEPVRIDYHIYGYAEYVECGEDEDDVGFIRFSRNGGDASDDLVFVYRYDMAKIRKAYSDICKGIEMSYKNKTIVKEVSNKLEKQSIPQTTVADEILKFKQLLDMGAITQEEYDTKKKELLRL